MRTTLTISMLCLVSSLTVLAQKPKDGSFTTSDGIKIHFLEAGSGKPIVFIPGWTMPAWIWQPQIEHFAKNYHVVAVDPRSQGESDKPNYGHLPETRARDYKELVDHLGLKQPVLVGWSMAVPELFKYVEQYGTENVAAVVLVDMFISDKPNPAMLPLIAGWMNQLQQDRHQQASGFVPSMFKKPQPADYLKRLVDASVRVPADTAVALMYNTFAAADVSGGIAKLNRPVLYAYQPDTQASADFLKSKMADHLRLERFEGDGHALFVDDPEKFNRVLEEFVSSLPK